MVSISHSAASTVCTPGHANIPCGSVTPSPSADKNRRSKASATSRTSRFCKACSSEITDCRANSLLKRVSVLIDFIVRSEEHTSELQSRGHLVCRLLLEKK